MEATMARLLSLIAHHPDFTPELDNLADHAQYIIFYVSLIATESNIGLIYKYAERVKQTQDALDHESDNHRIMCDLAQAVIRKWLEKKNWAFVAYPGKVGIPLGLYNALQNHAEAQQIAEKNYLPEGIDEKLDDIFRAMDRKKQKRKSADDPGETNAPKKTKVHSGAKTSSSSAAHHSKEAKGASSAAPPRKSAATSKVKKTLKPKKTSAAISTSSPVNDAGRRRSGRSRKSHTYIERDSEDDDEEMLDGVAEWEYLSGDKEGGRGGEEGDDDDDDARKKNGDDEEEAANSSGTEMGDDDDVDARKKKGGDEGAAEGQAAITSSPTPPRQGNNNGNNAKGRELPVRSQRAAVGKRAADTDDDDDESELSEPEEVEEVMQVAGDESDRRNGREGRVDDGKEEPEEDDEDVASSSPAATPPRRARASRASATRGGAAANGKGKAPKPAATASAAPKGRQTRVPKAPLVVKELATAAAVTEKPARPTRSSRRTAKPKQQPDDDDMEVDDEV